MSYDSTGSGAYSSKAPAGRPRRRLTAKQVLAAILIALAVVLCVENTHRVEFRLIGPVVHSPLWVLVAAALVLGLAAGFLLGHRGRRHR